MTMTGCQVFEVFGQVLMMIVQGVYLLIQALIPVAVKLAPLLLMVGDPSDPSVIQFDPNKVTPEQQVAYVCRFMDESKGKIVAAEVLPVTTRDPAQLGRTLVRLNEVPGLHTTAVFIPCRPGETPEQLVARMNTKLARNGIRLNLYTVEGRRIAVPARAAGMTANAPH